MIKINNTILKEKNIYYPVFLIDIAKKNNLSLNDFLLLCYFWDEVDTLFDVNVISNLLKISVNEILESFNNLLSKKLISLNSIKDSLGKSSDYVSLDNLYEKITLELGEKDKKEEEKDIFTIFEKEFSRPISSYEYEIIRAWLEKGYSEELVLGALKEAVYNGVNNLRYIDKILYEWNKKGFKNMKDVNQNNIRRNNESKELFDYNWLDDNE